MQVFTHQNLAADGLPGRERCVRQEEHPSICRSEAKALQIRHVLRVVRGYRGRKPLIILKAGDKDLPSTIVERLQHRIVWYTCLRAQMKSAEGPASCLIYADFTRRLSSPHEKSASVSSPRRVLRATVTELLQL